MIVIDETHLLMIEPQGEPSAPAIDDLTRTMAGALAAARRSGSYRGVHRCTGLGCRARSDNHDWLVGGLTTHSLAVHYVACHRDEIPEAELGKIAALGVAAAEPTKEQLVGYHRSEVAAEDRRRVRVERGDAKIRLRAHELGLQIEHLAQTATVAGPEVSLRTLADDLRSAGWQPEPIGHRLWVDLADGSE